MEDGATQICVHVRGSETLHPHKALLPVPCAGLRPFGGGHCQAVDLASSSARSARHGLHQQVLAMPSATQPKTPDSGFVRAERVVFTST